MPDDEIVDEIAKAREALDSVTAAVKAQDPKAVRRSTKNLGESVEELGAQAEARHAARHAEMRKVAEKHLAVTTAPPVEGGGKARDHLPLRAARDKKASEIFFSRECMELSSEELNQMLRDAATAIKLSIKDLAAQSGPFLSALSEPPPACVDEFRLAVGRTPALVDLLTASLQHGNVRKDEAAIFEILAQWHRASRWAAQGFNVFQPSVNLAAGLMLTEPTELREPTKETLCLPFDSFIIRVPPQIIPFWDGTSSQDWAEAVWIHHYMVKDKPCLYLGAIKGGLATWRKYPLEDVLGEAPDWLVPTRLFDDDPPEVEEDVLTIQAVWRFTRNFCHWLAATGGLGRHTAQGPRLKKQKRRKLSEKDQAKALGFWPTTWTIGKEVKLDKALRDTVPESVLGRKSSKTKEEWEIQKRFVVRGHMRNQPHGPGREQRKLIWIEPHWKGPQGAEAWSHLYKDEEKQ